MSFEEKLHNKFPNLFKSGRPIVECEEGWNWIIENLCQSITNYIDSKRDPDLKNIEVVQIKEKFASLRFYVNWADDFIYGMISLAETLSMNTCETCGSTINVKQTNEGWIKTLCSKCRRRETRQEKSLARKHSLI